MPEKRMFQDVTVMDKFTRVTAAAIAAQDTDDDWVGANPTTTYYMRMHERVIWLQAEEGDGVMYLELPPVDACAGYIYTILMYEGYGSSYFSVQDKDDSKCWKGDITLNGPCDGCALYSDGLKWWRFNLDQSFAATTNPPTTLGG